MGCTFRRYGHMKLPCNAYVPKPHNLFNFTGLQFQIFCGYQRTSTCPYKCQSLLFPMVQVPHPKVVGFMRYGHTKLSMRHTKHSLLQGLATPNVMGMSPCLNMFLWTSIPVVSNGTSSMSIEERVQEIQSHNFTNLHQNHETWSNSWAHSSISDGDVTILLHTLTNFNSCCIQRYKSHVHTSQKMLPFRRYDCTKLPMRAKTTKHAKLHGLIAPNLMGCYPIIRKFSESTETDL